MAIQTFESDRAQVRCAIYTRKSTPAGLAVDLNTLQTQREVCSSYIKCQAHRNWIELPYHYDDGGFSGGSLERPALRRLINDIEAGRIDMVVVYKIDRLSRSLADFIRLIDVLDKYETSFVSVTQTFDTSDSMGRLVLNILLTFAQFERELAADRTRDKKAALLRRGLFTGGTPPFGFLLGKGGRLKPDPERAELVREIYERFPNVGARALVRDLKMRGCTTRRYRSRSGIMRGGWPIYGNQLRSILSNPIYAGYVVHRGEWIKAEVKPLVSREQFDRAQEARHSGFPSRRDPVRNFLLGILHDEQGRRMTYQGPTGRSPGLRYYKSEYTTWSRDGLTRRVMVEADRVEKLTVSAIQAFLLDRVTMKDAVLSLDLYSEEIRRLLKRGKFCAGRIGSMDRTQIRSLLHALVPRLEVTTSELKLYVSCYELTRLLAWNGIGLFQKSELQPKRLANRVHLLHAPAFLICGHPRFAFPVKPRPAEHAEPKPWLVDVLKKAAELRQVVLDNRDKSIEELARERHILPNQFARHLRANYLAPDIQTAIFDGTQPERMTQYDILKGPLPLDWSQQRQLFGFEEA